MAVATQSTQPLTRKEFYDLAEECRVLAVELARYDQSRVSLKHCNDFNAWLIRLKRYDRLNRPLADMQPARPIARWQLLVLAVVLGFLLMLILPAQVGRTFASTFNYFFLFGLILFYFVPERLYGTTIELLEAKILRVVNLLEGILLSDEMGFSEAAFFKVKENLDFAKQELRQQIDLAHRRLR
jgi:hypothetical protein